MRQTRRPFSLDYLQACEYYTRDNIGRSIAVGVFDGEIRFAEAPEVWPAIFFNAVLNPHDKSFDFRMTFTDPKGKDLLQANFDYKANGKPAANNRLVLAIQLPPVPFSGPGEYRLTFVSDEKEIISKRIPVEVGPIEVFEVRLDANFEILGTDVG